MSGEVAIWIGVYGAAASTIALIWNIRKEYLDRGILRVSGYLADMYESTALGLKKNETPKVAMKIVNVGRRTLSITHVGGSKASGKEFYIQDSTKAGLPSLPFQMKESDHFNFYFPSELFSEQITSIYLIDSSEKKWRLKSSALKKIMDQLKLQS